MIKIQTLNATDVRKHWGGFIDSVIREKPKLIKRSRDYIFTADINTISTILNVYTFKATLYNEDDGSVTASLEDFDIIVNGDNTNDVLDKLAQDLIEYSNEYYDEYELYSKSTHRKSHLPYILNVLTKDSISQIRGLIKCQAGKT